MAKHMRRKDLRRKRNKNELGFQFALGFGILTQIVAFVGNFQSVNLNGYLIFMLLLLGDPSLACGIDYFQGKRKKQTKWNTNLLKNLKM